MIESTIKGHADRRFGFIPSSSGDSRRRNQWLAEERLEAPEAAQRIRLQVGACRPETAWLP